jgi:tripartite-type tricarboxylate transporter receptor subunit TctC
LLLFGGYRLGGVIMPRLRPLFVNLLLGILSLAPFSGGARAQDPAEFYKGKTVDLMIGYTSGGGYDLYARLLARHMGKHIPGNPIVVPKNMEGAGSLRLANWLYNIAPKDGTVFGTITRSAASDPLLGQHGIQYDADKFIWLGSANNEVSVCVTWYTSGIATIEDMKTKDLTLGATNRADDTYQFARMVSELLGFKPKMVTGYPGGNNVVLAMERGEVQGRCGWSWSSVKTAHPSWITEKKINIIIQFALARHPDLPDMPLIMDFAKNDAQKQALQLLLSRQVMGRPFLAPPGLPPERAAALRKAFMDTMNDKEFLADAERSKFEITPVSGEQIQKLVGDLNQTPPEVAKMAAEIIQ